MSGLEAAAWCPLAALEEIKKVAGRACCGGPRSMVFGRIYRACEGAVATPAAAEMRAARQMRKALERAPQVAYDEAMDCCCGPSASKAIAHAVKTCLRTALAAAKPLGEEEA